MNSVSHRDSHHTCCCLINALHVCSSFFVSITLPYVDHTGFYRLIHSSDKSYFLLYFNFLLHRFFFCFALFVEKEQNKPVSQGVYFHVLINHNLTNHHFFQQTVGSNILQICRNNHSNFYYGTVHG